MKCWFAELLYLVERREEMRWESDFFFFLPPTKK